MNEQHRVAADNEGNLIYTGGWVTQRSTAARFYVADMAFSVETIRSLVNLGGSGRNVAVTSDAASTLVPVGLFKARTAEDFVGVLFPDVEVTMNPDGSVTISDGVDVIGSVGAGGSETTDVPYGTFPVPTSTYGRDTFNAGNPFTLRMRREAGVFEFPRAVTNVFAGTFPSETWTATDADHYEADTSTGWTITVASDGSAEIHDGTDVVAAREAGGTLHDPSGTYPATGYGKLTYNGDVDTEITVKLESTRTLEGYVWIEVIESSPGFASGARGAFFAPVIPTMEAGVVAVPIAYSNGDGDIIPIQEGPIFWGTTAEVLGVPLVTISYDDYVALLGGSGAVPGTIYNVTP